MVNVPDHSCYHGGDKPPRVGSGPVVTITWCVHNIMGRIVSNEVFIISKSASILGTVSLLTVGWEAVMCPLPAFLRSWRLLGAAVEVGIC